MSNASEQAMISNYSVVDLFCGVGGLTHGFVQEGFKVLAGIDIDKSCQYAYETNNKATFLARDVEKLPASELQALYPEQGKKILIGCAPCQPFSTYTRKSGSNTKWSLLNTFATFIEGVNPDIVSMENVPNLLKFQEGQYFADFVRRLEKEQYHVTWEVVYCPDYGIPQKRSRLVLLASKRGKILLIPKTHSPDKYVTVEKTIGKLSKLKAGEICSSDPLHRASGLSETNLKRIRQSVPGGTWRDWDHELIAQCHRKDSGETYDSVYGRMKWNQPAPTMTTQCNGYGNGRFGHPEQDRAISMREAALFQTFPQEYEFLPPEAKWEIEKLARFIGNAVPVLLGQVIAKSIRQHLEEFHG
jgi:DNA (cytosine-5)-methyltransferase 1